MKKLLSVTICLTVIFSLFPLSGCKKEEELVLNVYNWEEYIACDDFKTLDEFEKYYANAHNGKKVKVNYSTFGTNENMYNELKLTQKKDGSYAYDLVCPSEYMIQKMIIEGMLEKYDMQDGAYTKMINYENNVSQTISDLCKENGWYEYATIYNWGTMGFTYNPEYVDYNEIKSWSVALNPKYSNRITIKDSVRDSYILALGIVHKEALDLLNKSAADYNEQVNVLLNDFSDETIKKAEEILIKVKKNVYGFEVDSGKQDMASGKLWINFAWSGDSVFSMDLAEENGTYLSYSVPEEGSNIFFDGWVMPKGANKDLAQEFLNFMYNENIAMHNLDYICYSSPIVGEQIYSYVCENYGYTTLAESESQTDIYVNGKYYEEIYVGDMDGFSGEGTYRLNYYDEENNSIESEEVELFGWNVKHFFGDKIAGDGIIYTDSTEKQLAAMYPDSDTINRCVVMKHLDNDTLKKVNNMWDSVKVGKMSYTLMLVIVLVIVIIVGIAVLLYFLYKKGFRFEKKKPQGYTLIKREEI